MSKSISQIDWLKERQKGIGGSDVVGIHRLRSLQLLLNFHFWVASVRPFRFL